MKRFNKYTEHTIHNENGHMYGKQTPSYQLACLFHNILL